MKFLHQEETRKKNPSSRWDSYLLFENRFMNFELVLKDPQRAGCSRLFSTHAQQYSGNPGEYWGPISYQEPAIFKKNDEVGRQILHTREIVLSGSEFQYGVGRCKRDENSSSC